MRSHVDPFDDADVDRFSIFVPAVMSAGVVFSLATLVRDMIHSRRWRGRDRHVALAAHATATFVLDGTQPVEALHAGLRPRVVYATTGATATVVGAYVGLGATFNYHRPDGYVAGIAWLWALSLVTATVMGIVAVMAAATLASWPSSPRWARSLLLWTPLGQAPAGAGSLGVRRYILGWAALTTSAAAVLLSMVVAVSPHVVEGFDEQAARSVSGWGWLGWLQAFDPMGRTEIAVAVAVLVGIATLRCAPFALAYVLTVTGGLVGSTALKWLVDHPRPARGAFSGAVDSFPSGHLVQATLMAAFLPVAATVLTRRRWPALVLTPALAVGVFAAAVIAVHEDRHWPSDTIGGILVGAALALAAIWALGEPARHGHCDRCPWSPGAFPSAGSGAHHPHLPHPHLPHPHLPHLPRPLLPLHPTVERAATWTAHVGGFVAIAGLAVLAYVHGIPRNRSGSALGVTVEEWVQIALLVIATLAWLAGWRWKAAGAVLMALAGTGLGVLTGLAYRPWVSVLVTAAFLVPAVAYWLSWQDRRRPRTVAVVALLTISLLTTGWYGGDAVYDHYYGPAHPSSTTAAVPEDGVSWLWVGAVGPDRATVTAQLAGGRTSAGLVLEPDVGRTVEVPPVDAVEGGMVSVQATGLRPGTTYRYAVTHDGRRDRGRGAGSFRTLPEGAASLTFAVSSCARTGSNGAVYDAIRAVDPDLYLVTGDIHYGNIAEDDPEAFRKTLGRSLRTPAQSALLRTVPVAYVWDDHDYGPNDAGAGAPTQRAARLAYRRTVPHYPLAVGDGTIAQAFTVGRVRVIMTDNRSGRTATSMLGARQLAWLERELVAASRSAAMVLWVNPVPWIAPASPGRDDWGGYADERRRIADVIAGADIRNLVMVSGDAHMVALDDGTNSGFASDGTPGFPVLHAAALDRPGNVKGGPYSEGAFPGPGQFATVDVTDIGGSTVSVRLTGRTWDGRTLTSLEVELPTGADLTNVTEDPARRSSPDGE